MGLLSFVGKLLGLGGGPSRKIEISKASASSGLQIIYGQRRVDPVPVFKIASQRQMDVIATGAYDHFQAPFSTKGEKSDGTRDNNDWLHRIDVWGQGPIQGIVRFWLDGDVSTGVRFIKRAYFRAASKYGTDTQGAASELVTGAGEWKSSHRGGGVAYTWGRYLNSSKKPEFDAEPELTALVKGLRVYDPRKDDTEGGTGPQRFDDQTTWAYSNNRALVVLNYLMGSFGFGAAKAELDLPSFSAAADACDIEIDIPAPAFNTTGATINNVFNPIIGSFVNLLANDNYARWADDEIQRLVNGNTVWKHPQYVANAVLDPKSGVVSNTKKLLEGMGWALPWSNGKHKLIVEGPVAGPVMSFGEDTILGGWTTERGRRTDRLNRVTVEFPNGNKDYETDTVSWPALTGSDYTAFKAEDNGQALHTNITVSTITNFYAAQAYGEYLVRKSRVDTKITGLKLAPKAMLLEPGDVIGLTYPEKNLSSTLFIVEKVAISAFLDVTVDLILYDPTVYGAPALVPEPIAGSPYTPDLWQDPQPVNNLQLAAVYGTNADGSVVSALRVSWDDPAQLVGIVSFEVRWRKTTDTDFENALILTGTSLSALISGLVDNTDYTVEVDYITRKGQIPDPSVQTILLAASASRLAGIEDGATRTFPRGVYVDTVTYAPGDVVSYLGSSYIFTGLAPVVGEEPGTGPNWTLLASAGANGPQGVAGTPGTDGQTTYTWIRYADDASGGGISNSPVGKAYIGFAYNKSTIAESNVPADYAWALVLGPQGAAGNTGVAGPAGTDGQTTYTWIKYSANADGTGLTDLPQSNTAYIGIAPNKTTATESGTKTDYIWSLFKGGDGAAGADALTSSVAPASIIIATDSAGTPKADQLSATSQITLYSGTVNVTALASYQFIFSNCVADVSDAGLITVFVMSADSAWVEVTATYGGKSVVLRVTLSKSYDGSSANSAVADIYRSTSTSYSSVGAQPLVLALSGGETLSMAANFGFASSGSSATQYLKFQQRVAGGTWATVGSVASEVSPNSSEPAAVTNNYSMAGPSSAAVWEFRVQQKYSGSGSNPSPSGSVGKFLVSAL
jgi:Putative phage tail protein